MCVLREQICHIFFCHFLWIEAEHNHKHQQVKQLYILHNNIYISLHRLTMSLTCMSEYDNKIHDHLLQNHTMQENSLSSMTYMLHFTSYRILVRSMGSSMSENRNRLCFCIYSYSSF